MTASQSIILVFWGQGFDEIAASIFIGELRRLGKRVKLVGLNSQQAVGQHGVTLVPDLPLGQALRAANRTHCIIIPAPLAALQQFSYDPRLAELLGLAQSNQAFIVSESSISPYPLGPHPLTPSHNFSNLAILSTLQRLEYPPHQELIHFVQTEFAARLNADR